MVCVQDILDGLDGIALLLDDELRVLGGGWRNWEAFWTANGGALLAPPMRGCDITLSFSPGAVRSAFRAALLGILRDERPPLRLTFRCDSARVQREMHLSVTRCGPQGLLYHARLLSERPWPARLALVPVEPERRCGVCARVHMPTPPWAGTGGSGALALAEDPLDWAEPVRPAPVAASEPDLCPRCHLALAAAV